MGDIRVGTSGWRYPQWRGDFYPRGLQQRLELDFLSRVLTTVELNGPFYGLRNPNDYTSWRTRTPDDFVFAVKAHREITHNRRLRDVDESVAEFLDSGVRDLGDKLGPILWQLPPSLPWKPDRFKAFADLLPTDLRHALEVRHWSWLTPEVTDLVRDKGIALVVAESAGRFPEPQEITADFVYVRLHGDKELYVSQYSDESLDRWATKIRWWSRTKDVYVYFDNTMNGAAPHDARALAARLS